MSDTSHKLHHVTLRTPILLKVLCSNPCHEYFEARDIYCCGSYIPEMKYKLLRQYDNITTHKWTKYCENVRI